MFDYAYGGYFISYEHRKRPERISARYELELNSTDGGISYFNGIPYERKKGEVVLSKPGSTRKSSGNFECYYIHFDCSDKAFCEKYLDTVPLVIRYADYAEIKNLIQSSVLLCDDINSGKSTDAHKLLRDAKITEAVLSLYLLCKENERLNAGYSSNIRQACKYISENYYHNITIEDIASAAMLSPSFTYVQFKKEMGTTPHSYLLTKRLESACMSLTFSDKTASQISLECGFSNPNYFCNVFKEKYSMTPLQYRKRFRKI